MNTTTNQTNVLTEVAPGEYTATAAELLGRPLGALPSMITVEGLGLVARVAAERNAEGEVVSVTYATVPARATLTVR